MLDTFRKGRKWLTGIFIFVIGGVFVFFLGLGGVNCVGKDDVSPCHCARLVEFDSGCFGDVFCYLNFFRY